MKKTFKIWDGRKMETSIWIQGDGTQSGASLDLKNIERDICYSGMILLQGSGLFDKHNKEIYEGDIIQVDNTVPPDIGRFISCLVIFEEGRFCIKYAGRKFDLYKYEMFHIEIIGNIYENYELIKK